MACVLVHESTDTLKSYCRHRLTQAQAEIHTEGKRYKVEVGQMLEDINGSIAIAWVF